MLKANKVSGKSGKNGKNALRNSIGIGGSGLTVVCSDGPRGGKILILGRRPGLLQRAIWAISGLLQRASQ